MRTERAKATARSGPPLASWTRRLPWLIGLGGLLAFAGGPLVWMALSSLKPATELFSSPPQVFPRHVTLSWYSSVLTQSDAANWFLNSFAVAGSTMVISSGIGLLAAHSVVRFTYPGRRLYLGILLGSYFFPVILLLLPLYMVLQKLHLIGTLPGLIAAHVVMTLPFAIWMLRAFLQAVPAALEEAAKTDGCSELGALVRVTLPLMRTGVVSTGLFVFILSWNEYVLASVITNNSTTTLPVGIAGFVSALDVQWGQILALGTLITLPILVFFALVQRYFEKGIMAGAIKG